LMIALKVDKKKEHFFRLHYINSRVKGQIVLAQVRKHP